MGSRGRQQHYVHVMYFYMHQSSNHCFSQDPRGLYAELDVRFHAGLFPRSLRSGDTCFWCVAGAALLCFTCQDARYSPRFLFLAFHDIPCRHTTGVATVPMSRIAGAGPGVHCARCGQVH